VGGGKLKLSLTFLYHISLEDELRGKHQILLSFQGKVSKLNGFGGQGKAAGQKGAESLAGIKNNSALQDASYRFNSGRLPEQEESGIPLQVK
jgi:hypothetical protein